jgi:hypothetical protein
LLLATDYPIMTTCAGNKELHDIMRVNEAVT